MGLFEHFPYTNFHSLNIEWAIEKIKELLQQGETLYSQLQEWKTDTDSDLATWKVETMHTLEEWEQSLTAALEQWKSGVEIDFTSYVDQLSAIATEAEGYAERAEAAVAGIPEGYDSLAQKVNDTTENTANLWLQGNAQINGFAHRVLAQPLPPGTYTLSALVERAPEITGGAYWGLSTSPTTAITPESIIASGTLTPNTRDSDTFTIDATVYTIRLCSRATVTQSSGYSANWTNIQIEAGESATPYVPPYTAVDFVARAEIASRCPHLVSPGDSRDMANEIAALLNEYKEVCLGPGDFYVSGLQLPENGTLRGTGNGTRIILLDSVTSGAAITMASGCTVRDCSVAGTTSSITLPSTPGGRNGILWDGTQNARVRGSICNVRVYGFDGGGIKLSNTGTPTVNCCVISDSYISNCHAGIYIPAQSEYHSITNVHCNGCYFGIVNNGGNNKIVNCGFDANVCAVKMGEAGETFSNNSHGTYSACTFNHNDSNTGKALDLNGVNSEVFVGCQFFYGTLSVANSNIVLSACNFGRDSSIEVSGTSAYVTLLNTCLFLAKTESPVTKSGQAIVHLNNCYTREGVAYTDTDIQIV